MKISYIVSTFNDLIQLPCVLYSLRAQTDQDFEVILTDNSNTDDYRRATQKILRDVFPYHGIYLPTGKATCFESADFGVASATADFVCFPSSDSYYMPLFGEFMYKAATESNVDLVMCDMIYDPRCNPDNPRYQVVDQHPKCGWFDKTGFIMRRVRFCNFPPDRDFPPRNGPVIESPDGLFAEALVRARVPYRELRDVLVVHN